MKTRLRAPLRLSALSLLGIALLSTPSQATARDHIHIPLPPPREILRDIGNFFHRVGDRVGDTVRRFPWVDEEEEEEAEHGRSRTKRRPLPSKASTWESAKENVPYRYEDADDFDNRTKAKPIPVTPSEKPKSPRAPSLKNDDAPAVTIVEKQKPEAAPKPEVKPQESPPPSVPEKPEPEPERTPPPAAPKAAEPSNLPLGTAVRGKRGLVYPPGAKQTPENMVDVTDFKSGQIVRDPRTGELFRVP
ncbi:MAG: hypothetical protein ACOYMN_16320 [Roseimicrobium sp.]